MENRMTDVEAGDYIEDDPEAWAAWVDTVGRYARHVDPLDVTIVASTMLAYLADEHGLFLRRHPSAATGEPRTPIAGEPHD